MILVYISEWPLLNRKTTNKYPATINKENNIYNIYYKNNNRSHVFKFRNNNDEDFDGFFKNFAMLLLIKTRQFSVRYTVYQTIREKLAFISR